MNSDLETLSDWFKANKLSVNASKTKYMVFKCKKSAEAQTTQPDLYIDNEVLEKVPVTKFLGVYIHPLKCVQWPVLLGGALGRMFGGSSNFLLTFDSWPGF